MAITEISRHEFDYWRNQIFEVNQYGTLLNQLGDRCAYILEELMPDYDGISTRINVLEQEVRAYFLQDMLTDGPIRPYDYLLIVPLPDSEANRILRSAIEFAVEKNRKHLKIAEGSRYVLEAITDPKNPQRHGVWMSCRGIKPDLSKIK